MATEGDEPIGVVVGGGPGALSGMLVRRLRRGKGMGTQNWERILKYLKIVKTEKLHITAQMD